MQEYSINCNSIIAEGQQVVTTGIPFIDGTIDVTLNGVLQSFSIDYTTLPGNGYVIFKKTLNAGDIINVKTNTTLSTINIQVMSNGSKDTANALYKKYSSIEKLKFNNRYKVRIKIDDQFIDWSFVSKFNPMLATIKKIQEDIGEFIPGFTDEYILSIIHRNGWEIIQRLQQASDDGDNLDTTIVKDGTTSEYTSTTKAVYNYVRLKSEIDLIYARYYGMNFNYGSVTKTIGDVTITKQTSLPNIDKLVLRLKQQFGIAENAIFGYKGLIGSFVKGGDSSSYTERGTF